MTAESEGLTLHLERVLPARRQLVFAACTEPELLAEWWGPRDFTAPSIELDLRVGGRYRIAMQPPEGELFYLTGEFREIDPLNRLAYTFSWEAPDPDDQETVVVLVFRDAGPSTEMVLDQGPFATAGRYELHHAGWTDGFERLKQVLSSRRPD